MYPFDTGAYKKNLYSPYMDDIRFEDLECSKISQADQRIVGRYFASNDDYFYGSARATLDPPATSAAARAYHRLLTTTEDRAHDDRCLSVEIQSSVDVSLDDALSAIALPDFLAAEPQIRDSIDAWEAGGVVVHFYRPQTITNASRTVEALFLTIIKLQESGL